MSELKDPKDYPKSLFLLQGIDVILYIVTAVVIYYYAGQDVTSPALGSASPVVRKVAYGIALPTVSALLVSSEKHTINIALDYHWWRSQRPRRVQVRLRPSVPWKRPYAQEGSSSHWLLDNPHVASVGRGLGHCGGDSGLQQPSEFSCTSLRLLCISAMYLTDMYPRPLSSQAGSPVCTA